MNSNLASHQYGMTADCPYYFDDANPKYFQEISKRTHDAKLSLQIYNSENAREIKAKILSEWNLTDVIDKEFKPRNRARKEPVAHDQYSVRKSFR